MVLRNDASGPFEKLDATKDLLAVPRMLAHAHPFLIRQFRGFAQDGIRDSDLANVVK